MNLTTVALPNLIAYDLVIVQPMSSMTGYVNYIEYTAGTTKGGTTAGTMFNSPFGLGTVDTKYTSSQVADTLTLGSSTTAFPMKWHPVVKGTVKLVNGADTYVDDGNGKIFKNPTGVSQRLVTEADENGTLTGTEARVEVVITGGTQAGTIIYEGDTAGITLTTGITGTATVTYSYNNVVVPQNALPTLKAEIKALPLIAKARRIAVFYSQIAAYQAKTDYGVDLAAQLSEKAVGQLQYEIDTEVTQLLIDNAANDADLVWSKTLPVGVSKMEHYEGFTEILEIARQKIYDATKRFAPNYMICASNLLPVIAFIKGWQPAPAGNINGPYFAGTLNSLKVFVTPNIEPGKFVIGVNGDDLMSSAAVYAPYLAITPTNLLQYADGGTTQGFSTLYDLRLLNKNLIISGRVTA